MIYLDTSFLVALHTHEPGTLAVQAWYAQLDAAPICAAVWAVTEFASALSVKQRTGKLSQRQAAQVRRQFEALCDGDLRLLPVNQNAFHDAAALVLDAVSGLRAGDALHLAVALQAKATAVATLDVVLRNNAEKLGIKTVNL